MSKIADSTQLKLPLATSFDGTEVISIFVEVGFWKQFARSSSNPMKNYLVWLVYRCMD